MPPSTAFDTQAYYKHLTDAGMEPGVAAVVTRESALQLEGLATKGDLKNSIGSLLESMERESKARKDDMEALRIERKKDMEALLESVQNRIDLARKDTIIRLGGLMMTLSGLIVAAVKLL